MVAILRNLSDDDLGALAEEIPCVDAGIDAIGALVESGAVGSNGEAKRLLKSGAISLTAKNLPRIQSSTARHY